MEKYDVAILGGGPGGYVAAIRAAQLGLKTVIIDKDRLGGICLNWGCIPTKALLRNAEVLHLVKNAKKYGIEIPEYTVRFDRTVKRSRQVAERLSKGVEYLMKKNRITHRIGVGVLKSATELLIDNNGAVESVVAEKIIIATGGRPKTFPGLEMDGKQVIGAKEAMVLEEPPERLVIIGAGAIGVEFAYFFNEFGSQVHLIEMLPQILPQEDEEVSKTLTRSFIKSGIKIHTGTKVRQIEKLGTTIKVHTESGDETKIIDGNLALVAVGITGNIENIGLEKVGVNTANGSIAINDLCQTNIPNIYAIGDVTGPPWLAHVASAQGHVAAEHAAGHTPQPVDYENIPFCTYCQPQVASVGLTEKAARERGHEVKVGKFNFMANGKALAAGDNTGFVKIVFDSQYGEILGCRIIGPEATELIAELCIAKVLESTWQDLALTVHAHPTLSEAIMEAAMDAFGSAVHQ